MGKDNFGFCIPVTMGGCGRTFYLNISRLHEVRAGVFGRGKPSALRLLPHNPHQALYRLRAADLTRVSRRSCAAVKGVRGRYIYIGRDDPPKYR